MVGQVRDAAAQGQLSGLVSVLESGQEFAAKQPAQDLHGEQVARPGGDPTAAVRTEPTAGDHTMQMGMKHQILPPGVQDGRDTDLCPQPLRIGGQSEQALRSCAKEQVVEPSGMVQHQGIHGRRQSENDVEVFHRQQALQPSL